jgi:hypothetical protein
LEQRVQRIKGGIDAGLRVCRQGFCIVGLMVRRHGQPKPPLPILAQFLTMQR